tara:strand:- start:37 stop:201 length:165 start_codon:yes stop_codon:yes gene_type:complete
MSNQEEFKKLQEVFGEEDISLFLRDLTAYKKLRIKHTYSEIFQELYYLWDCQVC